MARRDPAGLPAELAPDHGRCRFCGATSSQHRCWPEVFADGRQELRRCGRCAGVYLAPDFTERGLAQFYADDYRRLFPAEVPWRSRERFHRWRGDRAVARARAALIADVLPEGAAVFEMGSGFGAFLAELAVRRPEGVLTACEPDARHRRWLCQEVAVNFVDGISALEAASQDALVAFHVLEHLADPRGFLIEAARVLRPGGQVWIEVPDLFGDWSSRRFVHPAHLSYFSADVLARLASSAGLRVRHCGRHPFLAENLWMVAEVGAGAQAGPMAAASAALVAATEHRVQVPWRRRDRWRRALRDALVRLLGPGLVGEWQRWRAARNGMGE